MKYFDTNLRFILASKIEIKDTEQIIEAIFKMGKEKFNDLLEKDSENQRAQPCKKNGEWLE